MTKRTAQGAAPAASTQAPATGTLPSADASGAAGAASPSTTPKVEKTSEAAHEPTFPLQVVLRNHAPIGFPEPVTGAYLAAGGSATVTLHDEEHAMQFADSLEKVVETNFLAPNALEVVKA